MTARVFALSVAFIAACAADEGTVSDASDTIGVDDSSADTRADGDPDVVLEPALATSPSTAGTEHWVAFMDNLSLASNGPPVFAFIVSNPSATATTGSVEVPRTGFTKPFAVPANGVVEVVMPDGILYPQVDEVPSKLGVRITAEAPVEVVAVHYRVYFSEATRVLPTPELGSIYVVVAATDLGGLSPSSVVVLAPEDDTTFRITPSATTSGFLPAGVPQTFTLARGETMQFKAGQDLSGTRIEALGGKRLAVFAGARQANIACIGADSHLWDQMLPVTRWGTRHLVLPLAGEGATPVRLVAGEFKTTVDLSCQPQLVLNPGPGQTIAIAKPTLITSNRPIGVAVLTKSAACSAIGSGDPNLLVVPPIDLVHLGDTRWSTPTGIDTLSTARHWVTVLTATNAPLRLDGQALPLVAIDGVPGLAWAAVEVQAGPHALTGAPHQAMMHGLAPYDATTFNAGWGCSPETCDTFVALLPTAPPNGCDPGDLDVTRPANGDPGGPRGECATACDCYATSSPTVACTPDSVGGPEAIWSCTADRLCKPACGHACEACAERFPPADGRCP